MSNSNIKASHVIAQGVSLGDQAKDIHEETGDLSALKNAVNAYALATKTALAQVQYKKLTGRPEKTDFFED